MGNHSEKKPGMRLIRAVMAVILGMSTFLIPAIAYARTDILGDITPLADSIDISWFTSNPDPSDDTYLITGGSQLRGLAALVNGTSTYNGGNTSVSFAGKSIKVNSASILLDGTEFVPIGTSEHPFEGTFDGDGDSDGNNVNIAGILITSTYQDAGLFGVTGSQALIKNVNINTIGSRGNSIELTTDTEMVRNVGVLVGNSQGSIDNCVVTATLKVTSAAEATLANPYVVQNVGGVAGYCKGNLSNTRFEFGIPQNDPALSDTVLQANLEVSIATDAKDPQDEGASSGSYRVGDSIGGVVGHYGDPGAGNHGTISNCENTGTVWACTTGAGAKDRFGVTTYARILFVGGIAGYSNGSIVNCRNGKYKEGTDLRTIASGLISTSADDKANGAPLNNRGADQVGGIVGGLVSVTEGAGYNDGSADDPLFVINCTNKGKVAGLVSVGGILGEGGTYTTVTQCANGYYGDGSGTSGSTQDEDSCGMVTSTRWNKPISGGIVGRVWGGTISYCANYARVLNIQSGYYMAGIAGAIWKSDDHPEMRAQLFSCYNAGPVSTTYGATQEQEYREAGILGSNEGYVHDSIMLQGSVKYHSDAVVGDNSWGMWSELWVLGSNHLKGTVYDVYEITDNKDKTHIVNADTGSLPDTSGIVEGVKSTTLLDTGVKVTSKLNANAQATSYSLPDNIPTPGKVNGSDGDWRVYWYTDGLGYPKLVNAWQAAPGSKELTDSDLVGATVRVLEQARYVSTTKATVPVLSIQLADEKGTVLVQGADFRIVSDLPTDGSLQVTIPADVTGDLPPDQTPQTPFAARIEGLGSYCGIPTATVAYYGIRRGDFSPATVSVASEKYALGKAIFPQQVSVLIDGNEIPGDEYDFTVFSQNTTEASVNPNIVYDSAGFVVFDVDYQAYRSNPSSYEKIPLSGQDLTGRVYLLFDRAAQSYSDIGTVLSDEQGRAYYQDPGNPNKGLPIANDLGCVNYKDGSPAGLLLQVAPSASNEKFEGSATGYYVIAPIDLNDECTVTHVSWNDENWYWDSDDATLYTKDGSGTRLAGLPQVTFTGATIEPDVQLSYQGQALTRNSQFELHYSDPNPTAEGYIANRNASVDGGRAAITVRAVSSTANANHKNFKNYMDMFFEIVPASLNDCTITLPQEEYTFNGVAIMPDPLVKLGSETLIKDVDYTVGYSANDKVTNNATCTITALNNLSGGDTTSVSKTFKIVPRADTTKVAHQIAGENRYETATAIALQAFPLGSEGAIVCYGKNYPDSLAASSLAGLLDYPILITETNSLTPITQTALESLSYGKADFKVLIVGGTMAVSDSVKDAIATLPNVSSIERISGENRYQTQLAVYQYGKRSEIVSATGGWGDTFIVATGNSFADALSIAPYAARMKAPIFLVDKTNGFIDRALAALHLDYYQKQAIIVGGTGVVTAEIEAQINEVIRPAATVRLAGANRYETSREIARYCVENHPYEFSYDGVAFSTGKNFADALAGGILQAESGSMIILADQGMNGGTSGVELVATNNAYVFNIFYLGGFAAIPQDFRQIINSAIGISG